MNWKYFLGLLILLIYQSQSWINNEFCFPLCTKNQCEGIEYDKCTSCASPGWNKDSFYNPGPTWPCSIIAYSTLSTGQKYQPIGATSDAAYNMKGNVTVTPLTVSGATLSGNCARDATYNYTYWGNLTNSSVLTITHPGVTDLISYYKIRVWFGIITIDNVDSGSLVQLKFITNTTASVFSTSVGGGGVMDTSFQVCGTGSQNDRYKAATAQFWWSDLVQLDFQISMTGNTQTNPWGIMNFIVQARLCHVYCTICWGDSNTVCSDCDYPGQLARLSGTKCDLVCASTYGNDTANPSICIKCQANCTSCLDAATNCISCLTNYYLYDDNVTVSCINPCPDHFFPNTTGNDFCQVCNISCLTCSKKDDNCTSCYGGFYLYNNFCYSPCPVGTWTDTINSKCFNCDPKCTICAGSATTCSVCDINGTFKSYLLGTACVYDCGPQFYEDSNGGAGPNLCLDCQFECATCNINSTYCFSCDPTYYYFNNTCGTTCLDPNYFTDNNTWTCLDCRVACVNLTMKVYFKTSLKDQMICDLTFTQDLSWGPADIQNFISVSMDDPILSMSSFDITYEAVTARTMRITVSPKGYIFIYNVTFTFTTKTLNGTYDYAANGYKFSDYDYGVKGTLLWFLIKAPSLSDTQKQIIDGLSKLSDKILTFTTMPYVQQIKKSGVFALLMGGAQATSTACLINTIPSQNFYQGVRLWASFIFFDVPPWEQDSSKSKYLVVPQINKLIKDARLLQTSQGSIDRLRKLFDTSSIQWRFQRTGHTSFFIFDTYVNIFLVVLCWILLCIGRFCIKNKIAHKRLMGIFYSFTLKVHQITIFYISLTTLMQWIYFDAASIQRWISFGMCLLFNAYFLCYQLYIYRQMIGYPQAQIGNQKYQYFCLKYGSLLKNIRFQQYDPKQQWSAKHWFRPYNYHILSYYKKFLMMISLPIFYGTKNWQIYILLGIQILQIIRFLVVWPFKSKARCFLRLGLELSFLTFFVSILIQSYMMSQIMLSDAATLQSSVNIFYTTGWVGFCMVFLFNFGFIAFFIYDIYIGCRRTNRQMMDEARKFYYMRRLNTYEQENEDVPLALVNKWVKLGNLNDRKYDQLPDLNLRIQYFRIMKGAKGYEIDMKALFQIFMNIQFNYQKENNVSAGKKINKRFTLTRSLSPTFYKIIDDLYQKYISTMQFQYLVIKTFQKVVQSDLKPGQKISLKPEIMQQKIELQTYAGQKKTFKLNNLLPGFPISSEDLKQFV